MKATTTHLVNRLWNAENPAQGVFRKALCVCAAGIGRAPTIAWVLSNDPYNYNTRAVGVENFCCLVPVDSVLIHWADEIVFAEPAIRDKFMSLWTLTGEQAIVTLNIPDNYNFRDPALVELIKRQYTERAVSN